MTIHYNKASQLLIDKEMGKKGLSQIAKVSLYLVANLWENENATVEILVEICGALNGGTDNIMEIIPAEK